jgi:hypothetical protein
VGNIAFSWDSRKAKANLAKHGVSFEEAETVFLDESGRLIDDRIIPPPNSDSCCSDSVFRDTTSSCTTATGSRSFG